MDGPHDLGGRQGFGPIDVHEPEEPFHADWEARMWGMARGMQPPDGWNIDWFRHCRELIDPADYLTRPYLDQWMQAYAAQLIDTGIATVAEVASGKSASGAMMNAAAPGPDTVLAVRGKRNYFDREVSATPLFAIGNRVRCAKYGHSGHTRLPAYARGRVGVVHDYHGAHIFPDSQACGEERAQPLYTVVFDAAQLWPEAAGRREKVFIDLWQSYLEPAPAQAADG